MNKSDKTIWVIDDDTAILEAVDTILQDEGYSVVTINDPLTVENKIQTEQLPDLIYLDILMSRLDGASVAHIFKTTETTKNIPIIMLSANIQVEEIAKESKAAAWLKKPFNISELIRLTKLYIKNS